jgi:hypothetical protein
LQDAIVGALDVLKREVPVDRLIQVALVDLLGNLRQLAVTDVAAKADNASKENLFSLTAS